jgi:integrase
LADLETWRSPILDTGRWLERLPGLRSPLREAVTIKLRRRMRTTDPAGHEFGPDAYIFGDEVGARIGSIKTAWRAACRRAGITNLTFHDLRREFGSRLLESGASEHDVRDFLGHANITTTSRYLKSTPKRLEKALLNMESAPIRTRLAQTADSTSGPTPEFSTEELQKPLIQ